jgi:site-specific recombinase XerD
MEIMLEKSFGLLFFLKQPKNPNTIGKFIYLRVTVDGIQKEVSTKRIWFSDRWNQSYGRATGNKEDAKMLNIFLESLTAKIHQAKLSLIELNRSITAEAIKNIITGHGDDRKKLLVVFKNHNEQIEALVATGEYSSLTLKRFKTTYNHTAAFIKSKYQTDDIDIRDLDYEFATDYSFWLKTTKNCAHNSTMKYISTVKKIVIECIRKKWLREDPFSEFKLTQKEVEIIPLDNHDLKAMSKKKIEIERLALVRDIFLFSCYTGLAYVDVNQLTRDKILTGHNKKQWIITRRQKTNASLRIPLLDPAIEILKRYRDNPKCVAHDTVLPVLTNQKMNAYLKEIADICGIKKNVTFHIARHTFATTVALSNGLSMETVSRILGHKNLRQTQHYGKIVDFKLSEDMEKLNKKLFSRA